LKKYIYIGLGGALGAILRFIIRAIPALQGSNFPVNTLIINLTGSFLLGLVLTYAYETDNISAELRLGIATGFIGAFTTFSTLCKETVTLGMTGFLSLALIYVAVSLLGGLLMAYGGIVSARTVFIRK